MKLSILVPSNRPEGLEAFIKSFQKCTDNKEDIEIVVLVDDTKNYVEYHQNNQVNLVTIHKEPEFPLNVSKLQYECLKVSRGEWIMLGNDDCIIETKHWDRYIRHAMSYFEDKISLIYPNDGMFGPSLACFPIISRKLIDLVNLFPMPYHRYKVDDTIFNLLPTGRRLYLNECKFTHLNDKGNDGEGYKLPDGRTYPIERSAAALDNQLWDKEAPHRAEMHKKVNEYLGIKENKIIIGVPTVEMARRAVFYDYFNMLEKPAGTMITMVHGQSPAKSRNLIIEQAIQHQCTHVMFIDDDMQFEPDSLTRLLSHNKDMVTGFYLMRNYPHKPLIFNVRESSGACRQYFPDKDEKGLIKIINAGLGFCLIKIEVFLKMQKPWITLGEISKDDWCDDISFFNRAHDAGFELWCDLNCTIGHMASLTVKPIHVNGGWHVVYDTSGEGSVSFPFITPIYKEEEVKVG